ncbi:soluble calcium-activated nucleotidase 1 [Hyalella azteca]|uniref:Apyrase n=1 Tax=Hyalella azteca TaxID=294128 RepID=A0A8B7MZJ1_HYAAZ|nr:soluble calcium-activated nucleotidase 1 [Hyalella azteca]
MDKMRPPLFSSPTLSYKVGSSTMRIQTKFVTAVALIGVGVLLLLYVLVPSSRTTDYHYHSPLQSLNSYYLSKSSNGFGDKMQLKHENSADVAGTSHSPSHCVPTPYNSTYPFTKTVVLEKRGVMRYRIAVVADLDTDSKDTVENHTWNSFIRKGYLELHREYRSAEVSWDADVIKVSSKLSYGGRGLELSELVVFNGRVYSVDDRTGVVYRLDPVTHGIVPYVVLTDGDGNSEKGFKSEWATVKDEVLYIGGLGKEWTTSTGEMINHNPQWIKTINSQGQVHNHNWTERYIQLRKAVGIEFPGYMIHEAVSWSPHRREWVFLPRRASPQPYDEKTDERRGTNLMLTASEDFTRITHATVGEVIDTHGFSSFKFVPNTRDEIILAVKSEEVDGRTSSYIMVFDIKGRIIMPETKIDEHKYEGVEFF